MVVWGQFFCNYIPTSFLTLNLAKSDGSQTAASHLGGDDQAKG